MNTKLSNIIRQIHKYLGLFLGLLWLFQATSGMLLVFHRELDDWISGVRGQELDTQRVSIAVSAVHRANPTDQIVQLVATGGIANAFDLYVKDPQGRTRIERMDGAGRIILVRPYDFDFFRRGFFPVLLQFHTTLFTGPLGRLLIGSSGLFLLSSLTFGLLLAWPGRAQWRRRLLPQPQRTPTMTWLVWHRAVGLWLVLPSLVLVTAGVLLGWVVPLESLFGDFAPAPTHVVQTVRSQADLADAAIAAMKSFPGARISVVEFPSPALPYYRIRLLAPGEPRRIFGNTVVYVDSATGRITKAFDARTAPLKSQFLMDTYPAHTGEWMGLPGRLLALLMGSWLVAVILLGGQYWLTKRRGRKTGSHV